RRPSIVAANAVDVLPPRHGRDAVLHPRWRGKTAAPHAEGLSHVAAAGTARVSRIVAGCLRALRGARPARTGAPGHRAAAGGDGPFGEAAWRSLLCGAVGLLAGGEGALHQVLRRARHR